MFRSAATAPLRVCVGGRLAARSSLDATPLGDRDLPGNLLLGLRAEEVRAAPERRSDTPFPGSVEWIENLGAKSILVARIGGSPLKVAVPANHPVAQPGPAWFGFELKPHLLLDGDSGLFCR